MIDVRTTFTISTSEGKSTINASQAATGLAEKLGVDQKRLNKVLGVAWNAVARYWFEVLFPKHFTSKGGREYGYKGRKAAYMRRKAKELGHQDPYVWSGYTANEMTSRCSINATAKGATIKVPFGRVLNYLAKDTGPDGHQAYDTAGELSAVSEADMSAMAKILEESCAAGLESLAQQDRMKQAQRTIARGVKSLNKKVARQTQRMLIKEFKWTAKHSYRPRESWQRIG